MKKINQIIIGGGVSFFKKKMMKKYGLVEYNNIHEPAILNGMYNDNNLRMAKNHKSHLTIVWCGGDALLYLPKKYNEIKKLKNVRHIAKSEFISNDLKKYGIEHIILPITGTIPIKNRKDRGENIYVYVDKKRTKKYGCHLLNEIRKKSNKNIIIADKFTYNETQLNKVYKSCFIGLRLTEHDGLPNTVLELGLMGRMCVYNGELPNAIQYNSVDDIIKIINEEYERRHEDNQHIVDDMFNYLNIGDNWMIV